MNITKNDVKKGTSWDCGKNKSERTELTPANDDKQIGFKGNVWQTLSFYVEKVPYEDGHNSIWQIHNDGDWAPMFNWSIERDGLYTQRRTACNDPKIYKNAIKINEISYEEMLEMSSLGSKVMQSNSVQDARLNRIKVDVRSSFKSRNGTLITKRKNIFAVSYTHLTLPTKA